MSEDKQLQNIRRQIDEVDDQIIDLISQRAACAQKIAQIKQDQGSNIYYRPEREAQVLKRILDNNKGPLPDGQMALLFREIMSACLALESPLKVAFLGPDGTFTQEAAWKHFGHSIETLPLGTINQVFRDVESGNAHFGVVPIENSTEGVVSHTLDLFIGSPLKICGEVMVRVHHHLLGKIDDLKKAKRIVSHAQSFAQCRAWVDANLPNAEQMVVSSNGKAARVAAESDETVAIAGRSAADIYHLNILASNIESDPDNTTRFLIIGQVDAEASGNDKTSIVVSGKNKSGLLCALLAPFARYDVNMTRIESRPSRRGIWDYVFFIDIDGHKDDKLVKQALAEIEKQSSLLKLLGSYPKAVL